MSRCPQPWKTAYRSEASAKAALKDTVGRLRAKGKDTRGLDIYLCACTDWHLGHVDRFGSLRARLLRRGNAA